MCAYLDTITRNLGVLDGCLTSGITMTLRFTRSYHVRAVMSVVTYIYFNLIFEYHSLSWSCDDLAKDVNGGNRDATIKLNWTEEKSCRLWNLQSLIFQSNFRWSWHHKEALEPTWLFFLKRVPLVQACTQLKYSRLGAGIS